jgi:hypothetical protein
MATFITANEPCLDTDTTIGPDTLAVLLTVLKTPCVLNSYFSIPHYILLLLSLSR